LVCVQHIGVPEVTSPSVQTACLPGGHVTEHPLHATLPFALHDEGGPTGTTMTAGGAAGWACICGGGAALLGGAICRPEMIPDWDCADPSYWLTAHLSAHWLLWKVKVNAEHRESPAQRAAHSSGDAACS